MRIKCNTGYYEFSFVDNFITELSAINNKIIIVDKYINNKYIKDKCNISNDELIVVDAGEELKKYNNIDKLIEKLLNKRANKKTNLIAIGGGTVQDATGFIASILFRGIDWYFLPTTLLAQCDSCIGSKTSINLNDYKNMLGTFYPPKKIFCDLSFLNSLSDSEIYSGIGEMLHYYLINNDIGLSKKIVTDQNIRHNLKKYISKSLEIKKRLIEIDEYDKRQRNIFNYGHTFGHAIETLTNYDVPHGQAVMKGMDIANYISLQLNYISKDEFKLLHNILSFNNVSVSISKNIDLYMNVLSKDKKNTNLNYITCILRQNSETKKMMIEYNKIKEAILKYEEEYK